MRTKPHQALSGLLTLAIILSAHVTPALAAAPAAQATRTAKPPRIDGRLVEPEWQAAPALAGFVLAGTGQAASQQTSVRVLFDERALYFGFTCREAKMAGVAANATGRDADMDAEDHVEIFLGPSHDRFNFFQFAVGLTGARYDASGDGAGIAADWDAPWQAKASKGGDRWCAEVAIPFACLQMSDKVGKVWDMNLCRVEGPHRERSSWAASGERFRSPQTFGTLTGLDLDFAPYHVSLGAARPISPAFGRNTALARVANVGARPRRLHCELTVYPPSEKPRTVASGTISIAQNSHEEVSLAYQVFEPGAHRLVFAAIDVETRGPVAAFERNVDLAALVEHCLFHSYYRDDVSVRSRLNLADDQLAACRLLATLRHGAEEKPLERREIVPSHREVTITLAPPAMAPGRYRVRVQLEREGKIEHEQEFEFAHLRDQPVQSLQVHPRQDLLLVANGEAFFPLGIYAAPTTQKMVDEFKAAGFNTVRTYGGSPTALEMVLDRLDRFDLKAWVVLGHSLDLSREEDKRKLSLRKVVARIGKHPALLVWESIDEPAWGSQNAEGLLKGYEFLRQLDPHHPVWTNHAPRNHIATLAYFNRATDIAGCDIYPVPEPTPHTNLPNRTLSSVGDETDKNRDAVNDQKPVFMVLQGFAWRALRRRDDPQAVYPTLHQQRYMAYNAIVHGARGLLYWGTPYTPKPSQAWADLKTVVHELSSLSPMLTAPAPATGPKVASDTRGVEAMLRQVEGETYLVCINNENRAATATVSALPQEIRQLRVLYEPGPGLEVRAGATQIKLPGYGVVVATSDGKFVDARPDYSAELAAAGPVPTLEAMREPGNLVVNPSFEFDVSGTSMPDLWQCRFPFSAMLAADRPHSGKHCLRFTSPDVEFMPLLVQHSISVEANQEYELSAWFRSDGGGIMGRVYVEWVIAGKFYPKVTPWTKGTGTWQQFKRRFKATPPPGSRLYVVIQTKGKGVAWFDDVRLEKVGE